MKVCTKCHTTKELSDFFVKDKKTGRLHAQCKTCYAIHRATYYKEHYQKYGDAYRSRAKLRRALIKKELQAKMLIYLKDKSCTICGEKDPRVLDFDHIEPKHKTFGIAWALTNGIAWEKILLEIKKCRILCANCHRRHTAVQQNWYRQ